MTNVERIPTPTPAAEQPTYDQTTLEMLWELQSSILALREATPLAGMGDSQLTNDHRHFALQGMERMVDAIIRRGGENTGIGFE